MQLVCKFFYILNSPFFFFFVSGSKVVQITIEDINDNPPYFANSSYFFTVQENAPVYQPVGTIKALDRDGIKSSQDFKIIKKSLKCLEIYEEIR